MPDSWRSEASASRARGVSPAAHAPPGRYAAPLLDRVVSESLDEEYADVAARRAAAGHQRPRRPHALAGATLALIGLTGGIAFALNTRDAPVDASSRSALIAQVQGAKDALAQEQERINALESESVRLQSQVTGLDERLAAARSRTQRLGVISGYAPVTGPGVRVTVDDSPSGLPEGVVRGEDLALLVDGLWGAGAEAISINGKRLTVLSSISNSYTAINVNTRPLTPPYVVEAIGDPRTLQSRLLASSRGNDFLGLAEQLDFQYRATDEDRLSLPAARARPLRHAMALLTPTDDLEREGGRTQ